MHTIHGQTDVSATNHHHFFFRLLPDTGFLLTGDDGFFLGGSGPRSGDTSTTIPTSLPLPDGSLAGSRTGSLICAPWPRPSLLVSSLVTLSSSLVSSP